MLVLLIMEPEYVASDGTGNVLATCFNVGMKKVEDSGFRVRGGDLDGGNLNDGDLDDGRTEVYNCRSFRIAGLLVLSVCIVLVISTLISAATASMTNSSFS